MKGRAREFLYVRPDLLSLALPTRQAIHLPGFLFYSKKEGL
jgi:hypothetical protein